MGKFKLQWLRVLLMLVVASVTQMAFAAHTPQHESVGGLEVYYGLIPSEIVQGHPQKHPAVTMHGGIPSSGLYHLVVSVFDSKTGQRLTDANVMANVGKRFRQQRRDLEPMKINGKTAYGNFFRLSSPGLYHIVVLIERPGTHKGVQAKFNYTLR